MIRRKSAPAIVPGVDLRAAAEAARTAPLRVEGSAKTALETGRTRLAFAGGIFLLLFLAVAVQLINVSFRPDAERIARAAPRPELPVGALRADITDRNGVLLATNLPTVNLYADARLVRDPDRMADDLARVLPDIDGPRTRERLKSRQAFVYLHRHLTPAQQFAVNRLGYPALKFEDGEMRVYPQGGLFAHVIGKTDIDNRGISGVELRFDAALKAGEPLRLSLDIRAQTAVTAVLRDAMAAYQAAGAAAIVQDARTGEVVALTSLPDFDPNRPETMTPDAMFNRATLGVYEIGSVFKIFNTAIALESGKIHVSDRFDATAPVQIARYTIHDLHPQKRWLSVPEILVHSSNIGSARMALDFGAETQRAFLGRFGLLSASAVELPEVGGPQVPPAPWGQITVATVAFGHGISVSPLQVATAASAVVNGGVFHPATLVARAAEDAAPGTRAISERTSRMMRRLMRLVVTDGSGRKADVLGYRVAGKTGTAEKVVNGRYSHTAVLASFLATFPADAPRYTVLVALDTPKGTPATANFTTAGWNAAPTAGKIVAAIAPMLGVEPAADPFSGGDPKNGPLMVAAMGKE
ncbi:penicillin-binding protein 2 [Oleispirillum naphthae]|uniref:peptidoglycan D,D-transpeptidase FtsI family protein n=1 Tax=Oleispirillum naphthae TaxID=2838853 RepID=UPI0030825FCC